MFTEAVQYNRAIKEALIPPKDKLRFVNWYIQHGCDLDCYYCKVPKQRVGLMSDDERTEALTKLRSLCSAKPILTLIGGEPTLRPDYLVETVETANQFGFWVNTVTNGWGLTPELIKQLGQAGLRYLAISVDSDSNAPKTDLARALNFHAITKQNWIMPVINTVITRRTNGDTFKNFSKTILNEGCFLSPGLCSPGVPGGAFSNASAESVPTNEQLETIIPWLAWQKFKTGLIATSYGYLWSMYRSSKSQQRIPSWHCSDNFRLESNSKGGVTLLLTLTVILVHARSFLG